MPYRTAWAPAQIFLEVGDNVDILLIILSLATMHMDVHKTLCPLYNIKYALTVEKLRFVGSNASFHTV